MATFNSYVSLPAGNEVSLFLGGWCIFLRTLLGRIRCVVSTDLSKNGRIFFLISQTWKSPSLCIYYVKIRNFCRFLNSINPLTNIKPESVLKCVETLKRFNTLAMTPKMWNFSRWNCCGAVWTRPKWVISSDVTSAPQISQCLLLHVRMNGSCAWVRSLLESCEKTCCLNMCLVLKRIQCAHDHAWSHAVGSTIPWNEVNMFIAFV